MLARVQFIPTWHSLCSTGPLRDITPASSPMDRLAQESLTGEWCFGQIYYFALLISYLHVNFNISLSFSLSLSLSKIY